MFTDNPISDAQTHFYIMDRKSYEYDYKCDCCKSGFDSGFGVKIMDEKFCNLCAKVNDLTGSIAYIDFYREAGATDSEIFNATIIQL